LSSIGWSAPPRQGHRFAASASGQLACVPARITPYRDGPYIVGGAAVD
jgi:hypothetical protein